MPLTRTKILKNRNRVIKEQKQGNSIAWKVIEITSEYILHQQSVDAVIVINKYIQQAKTKI